jgi:hypothetical protein
MTYKVQIDDVVRDATVEETAVLDARKIAEAKKIKDEANTDKARQAVLDRLGITADEAALLLG